MNVWLDKLVEENNWQEIADNDTGDIDPHIQTAARKILDLEDQLQEIRHD